MPTQVRIGWRSGSSSQTTTSIVTSGLILNLDAGNTTSYSGTGTTLTDLSSTGNNGTLTNGTSYSSGYLTFDGVNDYVDMGNNTAYNLINLSVSTWVRPTVGGSDFSPFLSRYSSGIWNYQGWFIYYIKSTSKFFIDGRETSAQYLSLESNNTYPINNWYNVMWTKSGNTWSLYINGVLDRTLTLGIGDIAFQTNNMQIGGLRAWADSYYGKQDVGTVNIYNRVLSASEITQNFDATKARFGYSTLDTDVQAFVTAASITDATQQSAVNTLVTSLKSAGIWTKLKAVYPFVGGTATSHKFNLKDPRDLDAAYRLVFSGGWVHSSTGATPNGSNAYANTNLVESTSLNSNDTHISFYSRTSNNSGAYCDIGVVDGTTGSNIFPNLANTFYPRVQASNSGVAVSLDTTGLFMANRVNSTQVQGWRNTTKYTISSTSTGRATFPFWLADLNLNNTSGGVKSLKQQAFASIGDGLTDAEAAAFYNAVQAFQTTLGRQVGVPIVADTDAQAFLNAAEITSQTQASAVNTLVTSFKTAGIWTKMKAIYPFVGGSAASHKFNLKDPRDLDAAYRLVFNGGWVHSSTGAKPNGTTGYADTKLAPNVMAQNSIHASFYSRTDITGPYWDLGAYNAGGGVVIGPKYQSGTSLVYMNTKSADSMTDNNPTIGLYMGNRTSITTNTLFRNGVIIVNGTKTSFAPISLNIYLGADNEVTIVGYSPREQAFASIGDGLTDAEALAFYNAVQAFQTTLGRQV